MSNSKYWWCSNNWDKLPHLLLDCFTNYKLYLCSPCFVKLSSYDKSSDRWWKDNMITCASRSGEFLCACIDVCQFMYISRCFMECGAIRAMRKKWGGYACEHVRIVSTFYCVLAASLFVWACWVLWLCYDVWTCLVMDLWDRYLQNCLHHSWSAQMSLPANFKRRLHFYACKLEELECID